MTDYRKLIANRAKELAEKWFVDQCKSPDGVGFHLYIKNAEKLTKSDPMLTEIIVCREEDRPSGFDLVDPVAISIGWTKEIAAVRIVNMLQRQPILNPYID